MGAFPPLPVAAMLLAADRYLGLHRLTWLALAIQFAFASFAAAGAVWFGLDLRSLFPIEMRATDAAVVAGVTIAALGPPIAAFFWMQRSPSYPVARFRRDVRMRLAPLFGDTGPIDWALISLSAGFAEEFVFRGVLLEAFRQTLPSPWNVIAAVVVPSTIFGALHAMNRTYFIAATAAGVYFSTLVLLAGDLWAAALAHVLYDFAVFVCAAPQARRDLARLRARSEREALYHGWTGSAADAASESSEAPEPSDVPSRE